MKLVSRGDTTVVDAYLSPILGRYVAQVAAEMPGVTLFFMQSSGGLTDAGSFQGKDAILSGPAGGIVGMVRTAVAAGHERLIGFDMGGTSTDVSHFAGEFERAFETQVAGVRMRAPMMSIHTVAAGGGSVLSFDGARFRAGPESAGANPGPACYRRGGPLAVTDANVMLGKIQPDHFPRLFGPNGNEPLGRRRRRPPLHRDCNRVAACDRRAWPPAHPWARGGRAGERRHGLVESVVEGEGVGAEGDLLAGRRGADGGAGGGLGSAEAEVVVGVEAGVAEGVVFVEGVGGAASSLHRGGKGRRRPARPWPTR